MVHMLYLLLHVYYCCCLQVPLHLLLPRRSVREMAPLLPTLHAVVLRVDSWTASSTPLMVVSMATTWVSDVQLLVQVSSVVNSNSSILLAHVILRIMINTEKFSPLSIIGKDLSVHSPPPFCVFLATKLYTPSIQR